MSKYRLAAGTLAMVVWSFVGSLAWAQPDSARPRGGGGPGFDLAEVAGQKSVQEELKLSTDEVDRLKKLAEEGREARRGLRDLGEDERRKKFVELMESDEKKVSEIISPEQFKRLKQISLQVQGTRAFRNPKVGMSLSLTEEQKEKIETIGRETRESMRSLDRGGNPESAMKEFMKLREISMEKAFAVLTPEQQTKWKDLTGEPFKGELVWGDLFGGRGGFGGRNRN